MSGSDSESELVLSELDKHVCAGSVHADVCA